MVAWETPCWVHLRVSGGGAHALAAGGINGGSSPRERRRPPVDEGDVRDGGFISA